MTLGAIILEAMSANGFAGEWGFYPCDYLNEFELRRHAEDIVHANGEVECAWAVEVGTKLFSYLLAAIWYSRAYLTASLYWRVLRAARFVSDARVTDGLANQSCSPFDYPRRR